MKVFARSAEDNGFTSVVEHTMNTRDAKPIKKAPRRPPRAFIDEEERIIDAQLKANILTITGPRKCSPGL